MRKVIVQEFLTLNGLAAGPGGSVDFIPASTRGDQSFGQAQLALMAEIDTILLGRKTYEMFAAHWPNVGEGDEAAFAGRINKTAKIVFSRTLKRAPWGDWPDATVESDDPAHVVQRLAHTHGKAMVVWGSLSVARALMSGGMVDEHRIVLCPLTIQGGEPLYDERVAPLRMDLIATLRHDRGVITLRYRRAVGGTLSK